MRTVGTVPGLFFTVSPPQAKPSPLRSDVAGFIGRTRRGPVGQPIRVEGWRGYQRVFGGLASEAVMTYAMRGYFENEGEVAHVIRLCHRSATTASFMWKIGEIDEEGSRTSDSPIGFEYASYLVAATSPGAWANKTRLAITYRLRGASGGPELDFAISVPDEATQYFTAVSIAEAIQSDLDELPHTFAHLVSEGSRFVQLIPQGQKIITPRSGSGPHSFTWELVLTGGQDSAAGETPDETQYLDAVTKLGEVPEVALVAVPGLFDDLKDEVDSIEQQCEVLTAMIVQAEDLRDRLVLVDIPSEQSESSRQERAIREVNLTLDWIDKLRSRTDKAARAAATYHPRLTIQDPLGGIRHPLRNVPPSGHVAGVISRLDRQRGAHYTPANAEIFGTVDITQRFDPIEQARFNAAGVNLLRCSAGNGLVVWGGRTLNLDVDRRFIVYRRLIHRLVRAIRRVAEPLVFDINGPELWMALARSITTVLLEAWRAGALKGDQPAEAFRVACDEKVNPPEDLELGRVLCEIEVAPAAPMEFIQLRVALSGDGKLEVFES
jgi:phage tail sheath protein FI